MLSSAELVQYLVNVILVLRADGAVAPREESALETVRQDVGAKKTELTQATKSVDSKGASLVKVGRYSDQVRNLEDMLYVRLIDNNLSEAATNMISQFCGLIGVSQDQVNLMVQQACDRSHEGEILCPSCGKAAPGGAKFCPSCGAAFSEGPAVPIQMEIPQAGWAIEFCESTSTSFPHVLAQAKTAPSFSSCVRSKKNWYMAAWPENQFEGCTRLAAEMGPFRNRKLYRNGQEIAWDEVFGFVWCAAQRAQAYEPAEYCFGRGDNRLNLWGCKQARLDWAEWGNWFAYGKFEKKSFFGGQVSWTFDKDRIRHEVMTNTQKFRYCPHLRSALIDAVLEGLPNDIVVSQNPYWKYKQCYDEVPGSIKVVEVKKDGDYSYKQEYFSDGIVPRGLGAAEQMLVAAFNKVGVRDVSAKSLLGKA
jgi:hypothetical protein